MRTASILFLIIQAFSCSTPNNNNNDVEYDTLKVDTKIKDPILLNDFYILSDIAVPNYYNFEDSLRIDLNGDGNQDNLVLFTPKTLVDSDYLGIEGEEARRVLVEIIKSENGSNIRNRYHNLVSHIGGVLSKFSGIERTDQGFKTTHESGSRYSWTYECFFEVNEAIELVRIVKTCTFDEKSEKAVYSFSSSIINTISITDTLASDCNCDIIWENLNSD